MVFPTIGLEAFSAAHVTQLSRVTSVINQILEQVEPATSNVTHSGKTVTQSWQLKSGLKEATVGIQMPPVVFVAKAFIPEKGTVPVS